MNTDLFLVIGVIAGVLSLPSFLSAFTESRPPRAGAILAITSAGMLTFAVTSSPKSYAVNDVPAAFVRVFSGAVN